MNSVSVKNENKDMKPVNAQGQVYETARVITLSHFERSNENFIGIFTIIGVVVLVAFCVTLFFLDRNETS